MTKANSILHRAAALLAALCLLASMALPVYAAGAEAELSASNSETIPDNDNTENDANGTGADTSVSNLETIQKDGDTTNEGSKTDPEISAPDSGTIPDGAGTTDKAAGATLAEGVTGSENTAPADKAAAGKTTDADNTGEDSTGSEDEAGFLNEDDSADDRMLTAVNTKESDIALCADDTAVPQGTKYTFYFAPPTGWGTGTITCSFMRGNDNDPNTQAEDHKVRETTAQLITDKTTDGRLIYQVDVYHGNKSSLCPNGGFVWVKFALDNDHWVMMKGQSQGGTNYWMLIGDIANRCLDGNKLEENTENIYDYDIDKWVPYADITPKHVRYGDKTMTLLNKSAQALDNVTVTFWEKDDQNGFKSVGETKTISSLPIDGQADITIPKAACAYVSFQKSDGAGNTTYIGGKQYFNFYNDETETKDIAVFPYDPDTRYCLIYKGDNDVRWSAPGSKTVYFDATFSDMSYKNDSATTYGMPDADGNLWCYITSDDSSKKPITKLQMARDGTSEIWYVDVPQDYTKIRFASWAVDGINTANNGTDTVLLTIPDLSKPCFYADTSDDVIYQGGNRGGYWDELGKTRDAEKGKKQTVVNITKQPFQNISGVKYISSTLYDYYTDYELNGNNRDDYDAMTHGEPFKQQRNWVTFRQFNRTISDYYNAAAKKPNYPIYTGHFQSDEEGVGPRFSDLADTLDLYGWDYKDKNGNVAYRKFIATNNSKLDAQPNGTVFGTGTGKYSYTMLGLVADQLSGGTANGDLIMSGTTSLLEPHFNEAFLKGGNSRNAKIGEVYHDVLFPFTKNEKVFTDQEGVDYWWFDSSKTSLYMRQDPKKGYYLGNKNTDGGRTSANYTDDHSKNVNAVSGTNNVSTTYGFFPFNETADAASAEKYNYGFGAKLVIPFSLTANGQVQDKNGVNQPIRFYFSGDDDVWVYIDGKLALDIGGAHGKVSGILDFGDADKDGKVKVYVSRVKKNAESDSVSYGDMGDDTNNKEKKLSIQYVGDNGTTDYYYSTSVEIPNLTTGTHTLTMFYMERGMWESNMAVAYNFPDHNELQVEKEVDLTDVAQEFKSVFEKSQQKLFTVNIRNWATHYAKLEKTENTSKVNSIKVTDFTSAYYGDGKVGDTSANFLKRCTAENQYPPDESETDNETTVYWYAKTDDTSSQWRNKRLGQITLNDTIDIRQMDFLTFQLYAVGGTINGTPVGTLGMKGLYLQLVDENGNIMGCISPTNNLEKKTLGTVVTQNDCWVTIKLSLDELRKETPNDFNPAKVKYIRIGDDYERYIYFRNFTFSAKPGAGSQVGFTVKQYDIDDYGSVKAGKLVNAEGALFSSDRTDGMQAVDENGQFDLQNHEIVTFTDQFRRGSYISLQELVDSNIYSTQWAIYENEKLVDNANDGSTAWGAPTTALQGDNTMPDDNRTEYYINDADADNVQMSNTGYTAAQRPQDTNAIVFRSYSNPDDTNQFTKLKVVFTNKVKVGTLVIKKTVPEGETLNGDFTFNITFSNIGGIGGSEMTMRRTVAVGGQTEITGIPVGTRFAITEENQQGVSAKTITVTGDGNRVVDGTAYGAIAAEKAKVTATFENTAQELINISLTKNWQDAGRNTLTEGLPDCIYLQLQRSVNSEDWTSVPGYDKVKLEQGVYTDTWDTTFTKLDKYDVSQTNKPPYQYRVVEGTLAEDGSFVPAENGEIQLGDYKYTVSTAYTNESGVQNPNSLTGGGSITITNKRQKPKYQLVITKQGIDGENPPVLLEGVQFTLEVKGTGGSYTAVTSSPRTTVGGKCSFTELEPGSYRLTEVKTAEGYNLLAEPIEFVLTDKGQCNLPDGTSLGTVSGGGAAGYTIALTINNRKSFELPHTGADAPSLWLLIGLPALVAVLLVLVFRYNKKGGRRQ